MLPHLVYTEVFAEFVSVPVPVGPLVQASGALVISVSRTEIICHALDDAKVVIGPPKHASLTTLPNPGLTANKLQCILEHCLTWSCKQNVVLIVVECYP